MTPQQNNVEKSPNVIIINADDVGYGDVGVYGATLINTPNIDRLATEGRKFTDFHSASAVCSPSRYALLTGEYPFRNQLTRPLFLKDSLVIDTAQTTIASIMKDAGYKTAVIGKWHLGFGKKSPVNWNEPLKPGPLELGFDYYFGVPVLNSHPPFVYVENHEVVDFDPEDPFVYEKHAETRWFPEKWKYNDIGGAREAHQRYDDRMTGTTLKNKAVDFITGNKSRKFFLYFAPTNIHHPFTPAPRFIGISKAGRYGDYMHELDWMVGEIMAVLEREGIAENTLLIFTSDNGGMLNHGGQDAYGKGHKMNSNLLGFKFDSWEGGHRVPFIARWPGQIPAETKSSQLLGNTDILSTLAAIIGEKLAPGQAADSYNMLPALTGEPKDPIRDHLLVHSSETDNVAFRKGDWVYISGKGGGGFGPRKEDQSAFGGPEALLFAGQQNSDITEGEIRGNAPPAQLYNLKEDISQSYNLYEEQPQIIKEMKDSLEKIRSSGQTRN
ncbi:arylsulfatase [Christiangramia sp.]|uniref:sulfatase family protein n=1 Tax=Christiangramia sp. TaxID=1931228 RepID=UPI00261A5BBE|nr:arylsulfatase [Christiangramia sp.]